MPRSALILGIAGLIPFLAGAAITLGLLDAIMDRVAGRGYVLIVPADGPLLMIRYGTIILAFMSGALWGFAARAEGPVRAAGLALSVIPALWAFFAVSGGAVSMAGNLVSGFLGLLLLDWFFCVRGLAPRWWLRLRIGLTAVVVLCLGTVLI
jgi:hypothetical protein